MIHTIGGSNDMRPQMPFDEWEAKFKPIRNHLVQDACVDGYGFETYGEEMEYVHAIYAKQPRRVWTVVETDDDRWYIMNGWHHVNRVCYLVTEVPCDRPKLDVPYR